MGSNKELVDLLDKAPGSEQEADLLLLRAVARRKLQDFPGAVRDFAAADKLSPRIRHRCKPPGTVCWQGSKPRTPFSPGTPGRISARVLRGPIGT